MKHLVLAVATLLALASPARADWLSAAWPPDTIDEASPAITLNAALGAIVVMPAKTLAAARHAGLTDAGAALALLQRYGALCSDVIDLRQPHRSLRLSLALTHRIEGSMVVVTDDAEEHFTVDYVPTRHARCVAPEEGPVS